MHNKHCIAHNAGCITARHSQGAIVELQLREHFTTVKLEIVDSEVALCRNRIVLAQGRWGDNRQKNGGVEQTTMHVRAPSRF